MKYFLLPALIAVFLASCSPKPDTGTTSATTTDSTTMMSDTTAMQNAHTALNSLDWKGLYKGVLPCADCEGIETAVVLNGDNTYLIQTKYLGKSETKPNEKTGSFAWNADGNTVLFSGIENAPNQYFVAENKLFQLDMSGKRIEGKLAEKYVLTKQ